jgi:hypothetical protein
MPAMPASTRRRLARLAVALVVVLLVVGCTNKTATSTAASTPTTSPTTTTTTTTTPAPTNTTIPHMTAKELAWLDGLGELHKKLDKVWMDTPTNLTSGTMSAVAKGLRGCSRELARLGSPTDRLQPVYKLAKRGCAQYEKAAQCFATAAGMIGHVITNAAEDRKLNQSIDCGLTVPPKGSEQLALAELKGMEIKEKFGY